MVTLTDADITALMQDFKKPEIVSMCEELGLEIANPTSKSMIRAIVADVNKNGLPVTEGKGKCSKLLREFLIATEFIDERGKAIQHVLQHEEVKQVETKKDKAADKQPVDNLPPCYGFESDDDPSCRRCKVIEACRKVRIQSRPECFGKYFEITAPECQACFEASFCKFQRDQSNVKK